MSQTEEKNQVEEVLHPMTPPGGLMIWIFIYMELLVFGVAFVVFFYMRSKEPNVFHSSQQHLSKTIALFNTMILITSSYFVAQANRLYKKHEEKAYALASKLLVIATLLGTAFLGLKGLEYSQKIALGYTTGVNTFFDFYWLLTMFHAAHVVIGLMILIYLSIKVKQGTRFPADGFTLTTGSAWWHMCDLVWVILFPALYLL